MRVLKCFPNDIGGGHLGEPYQLAPQLGLLPHRIFFGLGNGRRIHLGHQISLGHLAPAREDLGKNLGIAAYGIPNAA